MSKIWRCACCGWHLASNCKVAADAAPAYARRVMRWAALDVSTRDVCLWCTLRLSPAAPTPRA